MTDNRGRKPKHQKREPKYVEPGRRIMDLAYLRDGDNVHTGEALVLAMLLHAKGKNRSQKELDQIGKMLNDPNVRS